MIPGKYIVNSIKQSTLGMDVFSENHNKNSQMKDYVHTNRFGVMQEYVKPDEL